MTWLKFLDRLVWWGMWAFLLFILLACLPGLYWEIVGRPLGENEIPSQYMEPMGRVRK